MDIIEGLTRIGNYFVTNEDIAPPRASSGTVQRTRINCDDIYNSHELSKIKKNLKSRTGKNYRDSRFPDRTDVVPNFYNQVKTVEKLKNEAIIQGLEKDSIFSDVNSFDTRTRQNSYDGSIGNDPMMFFKNANRMTSMNPNGQGPNDGQTGKPLLSSDNAKGGSFLEQFEDMKFTSDRVSSSNNVGLNYIEMDRTLKQDGFSGYEKQSDMTYGVVREEDFTHNNMVPNFKQGLGKGYGPDSVIQSKLDNVKQRKLDTFTGSLNNLDYRPKTERRPLFNPMVGLTNIYGMPNFTNYMETRYMPGRERRNEFLHQPVRITPGLNLNYNEVSKQGFTDTFRVLPKTVDELRTGDNPKISYGNVVIPGMKGSRRGIIPNMAKRKPITFRENDPRDMLKSLSYFRAPTVYGNVDAPVTNRQQTTTSWFAPAKLFNEQLKPESMLSKVKDSLKQNFLNPSPRNVTGVDKEKNTSYTQKTYCAKRTLRELTENMQQINPAYNSANNKTYAIDYKDIPQVTIRNTTEDTRQIGPVGNSAYNKSYAIDYKDIPQVTIRNTTEGMTSIGPVGNSAYNKTYAIDYKDIPQVTIRNTTEDTRQIGPVGNSAYNKTYAMDYSDIPQVTIRNTTENTRQIGPVGNSAYNKTYAIDYKDIPQVTIRNTTENTRQIGPVGNSAYNKSYAIDRKDIPQITLRNTTEDTRQIGPVGNSAYNKSYAIDYKDIPQLTTRNTTEDTRQLGPAGNSAYNKTYAVDYKDIPQVTLRNTTENTRQIGPAGNSAYNKTYAIDYKDIPDITLRNLTEKTTSYGPLGFHEKGAYQINVQNTQAPTTLRQTTQVNGYVPPAIVNDGKRARTRGDVANALINDAREQINKVRDGGAPTTCSYDKGPIIDYTMIRFCEPIQINRDVYGYMGGQRPMQCVPTMYTKGSHELPQQEWHFNTYPAENLATNPFINNTQHKSVEYIKPLP